MTIGRNMDDRDKTVIPLGTFALERGNKKLKESERVKILKDWIVELTTYIKFAKVDDAIANMRTEDEIIKLAKNLLVTVSMSEGYIHMNKLDKINPELGKKIADYCGATYEFVKHPGKMV